MKQTYKIIKDFQNKQIIVEEYSEIDGEIPHLLCKETYDLKSFEFVTDKEDVTKLLRNQNIYPPTVCMDILSNAVLDILDSNDNEPLEINFDDKEMTLKEVSNQLNEDNDTKSVDIDSLLEIKLDKKDLPEHTDKSVNPNNSQI